jgi:hypothetical protein
MEGRVRGLNAETLSAQRGRRRSRMAGASSNHHDPCYHELHCLSNDFMVLVFSKLAYLFERFCKEKKTKG